jgi:uncharacterized protein (TIGR00730 family)
MTRICVYCGSSAGGDGVYVDAARATGRALLERGLGLVYGGGSVGLMGVIADTVIAGGGEVSGVIPEALLAREIAHPDVTELKVVSSMHERKQVMNDLADGFIALPGGFGTFEELFEVLTWAQLGIHRKPVGVLDIASYWRPLLELVDHAVAEGFIQPAYRAMLLAAPDPKELLEQFERYKPPRVPRWLGRQQE